MQRHNQKNIEFGCIFYILDFNNSYAFIFGRIEPVKPTKGPSIKYVTLFFANFDPPPSCHTLSHIPGPPRKYVTQLGPPHPIFSRPSTKIQDKSPQYKFYLNCSRRFLSGLVFVRSPFVTIHLLQQKVKHHFKCHVS